MTGVSSTWTKRRLRHCLAVDPPIAAAVRNDPDLRVSFLPMEAIGEQGGLDLSRTIRVADAAAGYTFLADGDVVLAKVTPCFENGKGARISGLENGVGFATTEVYILRPTPVVDSRFLDFLLRSVSFRQYGTARLTGAGGLKRLSATDLRNFEVMLPPLLQQRAIADFLYREAARIDTLICEQNQLVELLQERRQAVVERCVTRGLDEHAPLRPSTLSWTPCVPQHWTVANIRRFAEMKTGHTPSRSVAEYWVDCDIPWFTLADVWQLRDSTRTYLGEPSSMISKLGLENSAAELLPAGTVVLSRTASVGFTGIMPTAMATSQDYWNWVCGPRLLSEYLVYVFRAMRNEFQALMIGSTHKTIYQPVAAAIRIPVPPLDEQRRIAAHLDEQTSKIDTLIAETKKLIGLARERRSALINAAVTGQIDVRKELA